MLRHLFVLATLIFSQGCTTPPETLAGPTATISDSFTGGGTSGGAFFVVAEVNGKATDKDSRRESVSASYGAGPNLRTRHVEREVPAGKTTLKLSGKFVFAAPIQSLFQSRASYAVEGVVDVDLKPGGRYRVNGILDAFRREIWLEELDTWQLVGMKIIGVADASHAMKNASFTCCNLRYEGDWISDANWATLPFIPAGSRITVGEYGRHRAIVTIEGRPMKIGHDYGREQETKEKFIAKLIVKDDPNLRIATFPSDVQSAIRAGKVMRGMTKEQVIMSLGYPRTDATRSIDFSEWTYWTYAEEEYVVIWGADQRVKDIDGPLKVKRLVVHSE